MKKQITIIAGHDTNEEREELTLDWLRKHNVTIEEWNGLQVLTCKSASMERGIYNEQYVIGFDTPEGDQEQSALTISLEPDPYDTRVYVEYSGDYSCICKGNGCVKCNEELEATLAGRNPYAHHTTSILASIETPLDPDQDARIRVLMPSGTGVGILPAKGVQDSDEALAIVKATYPAAKIVKAHELDEEVYRRQPQTQPGPVTEIDLLDIEFSLNE